MKASLSLSRRGFYFTPHSSHCACDVVLVGFADGGTAKRSGKEWQKRSGIKVWSSFSKLAGFGTASQGFQSAEPTIYAQAIFLLLLFFAAGKPLFYSARQ